MSCLDKLRKLESSVRRCPMIQPISFFSWHLVAEISFVDFPEWLRQSFASTTTFALFALEKWPEQEKHGQLFICCSHHPAPTHTCFAFQSKLIVFFRCGHIFHPTCLAKALDVVNACPVCKQDIPTWPMKTWKIYVLFYQKLSRHTVPNFAKSSKVEQYDMDQ